MMIIVCFILWFIGAIIVIKDYKTESTRWAALSFFFTGLGAFSVVIDENVIGYIISQNLFSEHVVNSLYFIVGIISAISHYIAPYTMLMFGISSAGIISKSKRKIVNFVLVIPPILSFILLPLTRNDSKSPNELLIYFRILSTWAVPYILGGCLFSIIAYGKEKSYLRRKHKFFNAVIGVPAMFYCAVSNFILRCVGHNNNWRYFIFIIPMQLIFFLFFAKKYGVLGVRLKFNRYRFAFDNIIDLISDSIVAVDEYLNITEVNKIFIEEFSLPRNTYFSFSKMIKDSSLLKYNDILINLIHKSKSKRKTIEIVITNELEKNYYSVEAVPIIINNEFCGTVLLFKNITDYKRNLELIRQNQEQLIEHERLVSLNQLIGGIAHNLKTPLMSSAGGIHIINRNTGRLEEYISEFAKENEGFDLNYLSNLMDEIYNWQHRIKDYLKYMSEVITVVKGQVVEYSPDKEEIFGIEEIFDKVNLLMNYEFKKSNCKLVKENNIYKSAKIKGNINSLIQVFNNIINNAIEASVEGEEIILGSYKEEKNVIFYVKNFGEKISEEISPKIFKRMVTTKGKNGTGLGLYISKSIIKGRFNGDIYFKSDDIATTFFIKIPIKDGDEKYESQ